MQSNLAFCEEPQIVRSTKGQAGQASSIATDSLYSDSVDLQQNEHPSLGAYDLVCVPAEQTHI